MLDNDVLLSNKNAGEYVGQSMLKFLNPEEPDKMEKLPIPQLMKQATKIKKQELHDITKIYNHNFSKCVLCCTHKNMFNCNVYIPGII